MTKFFIGERPIIMMVPTGHKVLPYRVVSVDSSGFIVADWDGVSDRLYCVTHGLTERGAAWRFGVHVDTRSALQAYNPNAECRDDAVSAAEVEAERNGAMCPISAATYFSSRERTTS